MNDKIANWILNDRLPRDLSEAERKAYGVFTYRNYSKPIDDRGAVVLLPVLVEKGYDYELRNEDKMTEVVIWSDVEGNPLSHAIKATISRAITESILMLIEREKQCNYTDE